MRPKKFPQMVKRGASAVTIYHTPHGAFDQFTVVWGRGAKRNRKTFSKYSKALAEAESLATKLAAGDLAALELRGKDQLAYSEAVRVLKPTGCALEVAAKEYAHAHKLLEGRSLVAAVQDYVRRHPKNMAPKPVAEAYGEFLDEKTRQGQSTVYLADIRYRVGAFASAFKVQLGSLDSEKVSDFLDRLKIKARGRNNFVRALRTFFRFCQKRKWLAADSDLLAGIEFWKEPPESIEIYTPGEMRQLLAHAPDNFRPCLAISGFAGLRSAEVERLAWGEFKWPERLVEVTAGKAKTATRRLVPVAGGLLARLARAIPGGKGASVAAPASNAFLGLLRKNGQ